MNFVAKATIAFVAFILIATLWVLKKIEIIMSKLGSVLTKGK
jgi:hypothetical protein